MPLGRLWRPLKGSTILSPERLRAVFGFDPGPRPMADPHVPNPSSVTGSLTVDMGRARSWHGLDQRMMFPASSTRSGDGSGESVMKMLPLGRTSTAWAPSAFAARITRAMSANGMVRPCSGPTSERSWHGEPFNVLFVRVM